jgi:DNA-3-methyladenine glycosylase I
VRTFLDVQTQDGGFDAFVWRFVDGQPVQNAWQTMQPVPASTSRQTTI